MNKEKSIFVTQPFIPPINEFIPYLNKIWDSKILTNGGPLHEELENQLCKYLNVKHLSLFSNGTLALITALQALRITGEVITTPYSFVATSHSLLWHGNKPVFVDIDPNTLNINPELIEAAITPQTTAILAVHCYGNPCDVDKIKIIADNYNLKVIYDACHAFGVTDNGGSILRHGDMSVVSFHATKIFNTFEGGAIVCADSITKQRVDRLKNFGFVDETTVIAPGINGKMSEINAAFGLCQLPHMDFILKRRSEIDALYREGLQDISGIEPLPRGNQVVDNFSYFPVFVNNDFPISRDELYENLKIHNIFSRRYFYPLISEFSMYKSFKSSSKTNLINATNSSAKVLCLPIYPSLSNNDVFKIIEKISLYSN